MNKFLLIACLSCITLPSLAQNGVRYTVQNQTGGLGGATYPVTTPVTFSSLELLLTYADLSTFTEFFAGSVGVSQSKNSGSYLLVDPTHGAITSAQISGLYSTLNWQESPTFAGPKTAVTVSNPFTATLTGGTFKFAFIDGVSTTTGTAYHAGNLSSGPVAITITPEPGAFALLLGLGISGAMSRRRLRRR